MRPRQQQKDVYDFLYKREALQKKYQQRVFPNIPQKLNHHQVGAISEKKKSRYLGLIQKLFEYIFNIESVHVHE